MRHWALPVVLVVMTVTAHDWLSGGPSLEQPSQDSEGTWSVPPRLFWPTTMPPPKEIFRGLLAEIDARFILFFRNGEVIQVEALAVDVRTLYDPLPKTLELERDVISWGRHSLRKWETSRIDPFHLEVAIQFRTDSSLEENVVLYRVEYDLNGPDPGAFHPARVFVTTSPWDVAGWKERVEKNRRHEEHLRSLREGRSPE
jgi:hypothetical protein